MHYRVLKQGLFGVGFLAVSLFASAGIVEAAATPPDYTLDAQAHVITIHPAADVTKEINAAVAYLINRPDKTNRWTLKFDGGRYVLTGHIYADNLQNVDFVSERTNPAILIKGPSYANEYLLYSRFSKNITVSGFQFYGKTKNYDSAMNSSLQHPSWGDQGLYFASSNGITIDKNRFNDFGNAALRVTTSESDPTRGVNSFNTTVINNAFNNIYQVTTTSNSLINGASANFLFQNNNIFNLHGSIKFASRTSGAANVWVIGNTINNSDTDGIEIASYVNLEVSYNRLLNIARHAVNCYTNLRATPGFQWGDNISFKGNIIDNAGGGIRFDSVAYSDGFKATPRNVQVIGNTISHLRGSAPAISFVNGPIQGLVVQNNKLSDIAGKPYISLFNSVQTAQTSGNTVNSQLYQVTN